MRGLNMMISMGVSEPLKVENEVARRPVAIALDAHVAPVD